MGKQLVTFAGLLALVLGVWGAAAEEGEAPTPSPAAAITSPITTDVAQLDGTPVFQPGAAAGGAGLGDLSGEIDPQATVIWEAECNDFWCACTYNPQRTCRQDQCFLC